MNGLRIPRHTFSTAILSFTNGSEDAKKVRISPSFSSSAQLSGSTLPSLVSRMMDSRLRKLMTR